MYDSYVFRTTSAFYLGFDRETVKTSFFPFEMSLCGQYDNRELRFLRACITTLWYCHIHMSYAVTYTYIKYKEFGGGGNGTILDL